jgi:hypothetical protein
MALVLLVLAIRQCIGLANDDAFITYRYARNLASGLGFVFNPGERVLGTTTPLYTFLLAPIGLVEDWLPFASNALGCLGVAFQAWAVGRILRRLGADRFFGAGAAFFVLGGGIGSYWHVGLETNVLAALMIWSVERLIVGRFGWAGVLAGLAAVCRLDSVLLAVLLCFEIVVHQRKNWRVLVSPALGFVVVLAPWMAFSLFYFGALFPNSLQAKLHSVSSTEYALRGAVQLERSLFTLAQSHSLSWITLSLPPSLLDLLAIAVAGGLLGFAFFKAWSNKEAIASVLLFPVVLLLAYLLIGPPLEHTWHLYPAELLLYLGVVIGLLRLLQGWLPDRHPPAWLAWAAVAGMSALGLWHLGVFPTRYRSDLFYGQRARALAEMGRLVSARTPPEASVSAREVGILGYLCRNPIVDRTGIITPGLNYHHPRLYTSLTRTVQLHPTDYIVVEMIELPEVSLAGSFEVLAAGRSPGYVPFFLLARQNDGDAATPRSPR